MASAMAATATAATLAMNLNRPFPAGCNRVHSLASKHGLCFKSLALKSQSRRRSNVVYGLNSIPRFRCRPFALAEQQASHADVEQVDEEANKELEDGGTQVNGAESATEAESVAEVLLRSYTEAVLGNDQETMISIHAQIEGFVKERDTLSQQVAALSEESSLAKERVLRLNADFDNFRKRSGREKDSLRETVKGDVIESLLPMIDNFERAKGAIKAETEGEKKIDSSYQGIYKQFVDIMKSLGVKVVDTVGKPFNPELHEAIMREESEEFAEGIVTQEFRRGFLIGEKLLRAAMVKVSSGKPTTTAAEESAQATDETGETNDA